MKQKQMDSEVKKETIDKKKIKKEKDYGEMLIEMLEKEIIG